MTEESHLNIHLLLQQHHHLQHFLALSLSLSAHSHSISFKSAHPFDLNLHASQFGIIPVWQGMARVLYVAAYIYGKLCARQLLHPSASVSSTSIYARA